MLRWLLLMRKHYQANLTPPILEEAFQPRKKDDRGLSLSRRKSDAHPEFPDEWEFKARNRYPEAKLRDTCGVCAVLVQAARKLGLRVEPDPIVDDDPGEVRDPSHVLLPDINSIDFGTALSTSDNALRKISNDLSLTANALALDGGSTACQMLASSQAPCTSMISGLGAAVALPAANANSFAPS